MSRLIALVALVIAVLSLGLNVLLIVRLDQGRTAATDMLDRTSLRLGSLATMSYSQTVRINRAFSVSGEMPLNQTFVIPISMTVPVNTSLNVNANTPFGQMNMPVNVNTSVPFKMQFPVTISRTIPYSLSVPVDLQIPVEIRLRDLGLEPMIRDTQNEILLLRDALQ